MRYLLVKFTDGTTGYQVSNDTTSVVVDMLGNPVSNETEYTTIDDNPQGNLPLVTL